MLLGWSPSPLEPKVHPGAAWGHLQQEGSHWFGSQAP